MHLPAPTESNFTPVPAGTHLGICYRVIDMGTQSSTFDGETKQAHKVMISWEIPDEKMDDGRPFTISKTYTFSTHEKATLRKDLEAWRGMAFTPRDFGPTGFDIKNVLGKACTLSVVHAERLGKTYANVASVGKLMKGVATPPLVNQLVYLCLNSTRWDAFAFASLPAYLQGKITASPEYIEMMNTSDGNGNHHQDDSTSEDIPF